MKIVSVAKGLSLFVILVSRLGALEVEIDLTNDSGTLGELFNDVSSGTFLVPGGSGLEITIEALSTDSSLNSNVGSPNRLGINSTLSGEDADDFDVGEFVEFSFSKSVEVTSLDFVSFGAGETFSFAGQSITGAQNLYAVPSPVSIAANTSFRLESISGTMGLQAITLNVVPEPSETAAVFGIAGMLFVFRHRRRRAHVRRS